MGVARRSDHAGQYSASTGRLPGESLGGRGTLAKVVVITSGKGGVGKTTSSAAFAAGLALRGHRTVVIDFDVGLRNLDLIMGCERRVVFDFINVITVTPTSIRRLSRTSATTISTSSRPRR